MHQEISESDKRILFWACFLSLMAAGVGFAYRVMVLGTWQAEFNLTGAEMGGLFGASLWPIAITMILFSLIVDKVGHKPSMFVAFGLQGASAVLNFMADSPSGIYLAGVCAGLGHGIVEAVINPVCATMYRNEKSKWLNILHAAWPAGIVFGGIFMLVVGTSAMDWRTSGLIILLPVLVYGIMFIKPKFPVDERVQNNIPYYTMLKEVGFFPVAMATFLIFYELSGVFAGPFGYEVPDNILGISLVVGLIVGGAFGAYTKSFGKPLYIFLCLIMVPLATTELGTDAWIKELMTPTMGEYAGWAIVASAFIMMVLRFQAGVLTKRFSAPTVLIFSSFFSFAGLMVLSFSGGWVVWLAFILYAVGQTFYWPMILGFASERFPKGGALTLNTVTAIGLVSVGTIGTKVLGVFNDNHTTENVKVMSAEIYEASKTEAEFFGVPYEAIDKAKATELSAGAGLEGDFVDAVMLASRQSLRSTAIAFPFVMMIAFVFVALYFRSKGGYKPIDLEKES